MDPLSRVFENLDRWRHLPGYQLERRADIFFSAYLEDVVEEVTGVPLEEEIIPELRDEGAGELADDTCDQDCDDGNPGTDDEADEIVRRIGAEYSHLSPLDRCSKACAWALDPDRLPPEPPGSRAARRNAARPRTVTTAIRARSTSATPRRRPASLPTATVAPQPGQPVSPSARLRP